MLFHILICGASFGGAKPTKPRGNGAADYMLLNFIFKVVSFFTVFRKLLNCTCNMVRIGFIDSWMK